MRAVDLTHSIQTGMPVFPGDPGVVCTPSAVIERDGYAVTALSLGSHAGTHMDAPAHLLPGLSTLDGMGVDNFMGSACVVDCTAAGPGGEIGAGLLSGLTPADFILLHTGWDRLWGGPDYFEGYPALTPGAARLLSRLAGRGVGIDTPSPDPVRSAACENHRLLLTAGLLLVENLTGLSALRGARFFFCALPLKLARADGAPVRAVALLEDAPFV